TRAAQRQAVVHVVLDAHQRIKQHLVVGLQLDIELLHIRPLVPVRVVTVDFELQNSFGAHSSVLLRKSALWAGRTRPSAASTERACTRGGCPLNTTAYASASFRHHARDGRSERAHHGFRYGLPPT